MTATQEASTAPPVSRAVFVETLRQVADLVERGAVPAPTAIVGDVGGDAVVHVRAEDLSAWVIALDLPAPSWEPVVTSPGWIRLRACWPDDARFELIYTLSAERREPTTFDPEVDPTPTRDAELCPPACWAADLGIGA